MKASIKKPRKHSYRRLDLTIGLIFLTVENRVWCVNQCLLEHDVKNKTINYYIMLRRQENTVLPVLILLMKKKNIYNSTRSVLLMKSKM